MNQAFANTLKKIRTEKGLSQQTLADKMFVTQSTVARWEKGSRLPDAVMTTRLATVLGVDVNTLLTASESDECPNVILVDDMKLILSDGLPVLEEVIPNANVIGFIDAEEEIEYAKNNRVSFAFFGYRTPQHERAGFVPRPTRHQPAHQRGVSYRLQ